MRVAALVCLSAVFGATPLALADTPTKPFDAAEFASYYSQAKNYRSVKRDVLGWHKTTRNGCVAFASTALRHRGIAIPLRAKRDGWGISRITFAFSDYLTEELGWRRVNNPAKLEPGDLVFTTGAPDHVFVFHSYRDRRRLIARAIDNKMRKGSRPLLGSRKADIAAFAYALRSP